MKKIKFIIIEGTDCSGKSSIKRLLNKRTNSEWCIIDRLFGSLITYGKYYNRQSVDFDKYYEVDEMLAGMGGVLIYLWATPDELERRLNKRGDDSVDIEDIKKLQIEYNNYLNNTKLPKLVINTTDLSKDEVVDKIIELLATLGTNYYSK